MNDAVNRKGAYPSGLAEIVDRLALRDLVDRYAHAVDNRDRPALMALFSADAVVRLPTALARGLAATHLRGPNEIGTLLDSVSGFRRTAHVVSQQLIQLDGDRAGGEIYCTAHHIHGREGSQRDYALSLRYRDEYVRNPAGWLFRQRDLVADFAHDQPVTIPGGPDPTQ